MTDLYVDAGLMSVVPLSLVKQGKHADLDKAIADMLADETLKFVPTTTGVVFRLFLDHGLGFSTEMENSIVTEMCLQDDWGTVGNVQYDKGVYVLGDPCYLLDDPDDNRDSGNYFKLLRALMPDFNIGSNKADMNAVIALIDGLPVVVCRTGWGDGQYPAVMNYRNDFISLQVLFDEYDDDDENDY